MYDIRRNVTCVVHFTVPSMLTFDYTHIRFILYKSGSYECKTSDELGFCKITTEICE